MKRQISIFLVFLLVFSLFGCQKSEQILFYYPRTEIRYGVSDGVIAVEERDIEDGSTDLSFLLKLYLEGPVSQELRSPFPRGTALEDLTLDESTIIITLSEPFGMLENLEYIIACACVASTCFGLTDAEAVTIFAGQTEMTLTRNNLSLTDQTTATIPE